MSIKELVESAIADSKVAIFSKSYCPYCKRAKALFASEFPDVKPTIFELDEREDGAAIQAYLLEKTSQRTVPNVFVAQEHVGGSDDLTAFHKAGKLAKLVRV